MSKFRVALATGFAASALILIPAGTASAHVHAITPLNCIEQEASNAGADQVDVTPALENAGLTGPIPVTKGGNVTIGGEGADAAVCDPDVPQPTE
jgi:hypothetical protein